MRILSFTAVTIFCQCRKRNDPDANVRKQARWALDLRDLEMGKRINER